MSSPMFHYKLIWTILVIEHVIVANKGIYKEKEHVHFLYPDLSLSELYFLKVVREGELVEEENGFGEKDVFLSIKINPIILEHGITHAINGEKRYVPEESDFFPPKNYIFFHM